MTFTEVLAARVSELEEERRRLQRRLYRVQRSRDLWRVRAGVRPRVVTDRIVDGANHGTRSAYNRGCQCAKCRAAESAYQRARYLRSKAA